MRKPLMKLKQALAENDLTDAKMKAHTVKGAASNLGGTAVAEQASLLEQLLETGTTVGDAELAPFSAALNSFVNAINDLPK